MSLDTRSESWRRFRRSIPWLCSTSRRRYRPSGLDAFFPLPLCLVSLLSTRFSFWSRLLSETQVTKRLWIRLQRENHPTEGKQDSGISSNNRQRLYHRKWRRISTQTFPASFRSFATSAINPATLPARLSTANRHTSYFNSFHPTVRRCISWWILFVTQRSLTMRRWSQPLAAVMITSDLMKQLSMFATLVPASGGSAPSR